MSDTLKKREHIQQFDFMRTVCALGIVFYHVLCLYEGMGGWNIFPIKSVCANGDWGHTAIVTVFFMLSGASLYYNYPTIPKGTLKQYYFKRWKSLFPTFYLVWGYAYMIKILQVRNVLYAGSPILFLLTLFGLDGYTYYSGVNYNQVGEWFLGALVLLYALYPFFVYLYRKCKWPTVFVTTFLFLLNIKMDWFLIEDSDNLITCLFCFMLGMLAVEYRGVFDGKIAFTVLSFAMILLLWFLPLPTNRVCLMIALGFFLFVFLYNIAPVIYRIPVLHTFSKFVSGISYEIFLVHHILMHRFFGYLCEPPATPLNIPQEIGCILAVIALSIITAKMVSLLMNWILTPRTKN